jgi:short-subunit dehydrogenase
MSESVLIVGAGLGLSASLARLCNNNGMKVVLAARNIKKLDSLKKEINAETLSCDVGDIQSVYSLFESMDKSIGTPNLVIYNPSVRIKGSIIELDAEETRSAINITCFGAFLVAQEAAKRMLSRGSGSIFFTGASAGVKGFANSSVFAMGKFGLRGLAQSLARELHPNNIHIGHFIIDGGIQSKNNITNQFLGKDNMLDPDSIAKSYLEFHRQDRSAWAWEIELRPWVEKF